MTASSESVERFGFHAANDSSRPVHQNVRAAFAELDTWLINNLPDGREKSCARTALQEAAMWSNAAVAINLGDSGSLNS